jgi:hypothetical protein
MPLPLWFRRLFASKPSALHCCPPTGEGVEDRAQPTITFKSAGVKAEQHRESSAAGEQALGSLVHTDRLSPVTIGFWLGAAGMGTGGCLMGALMAYRHPVAVAISVLWWGIYFGAFGASIGALLGLLANHAPPRAWARRERGGNAATELDLDSLAAHAGSNAVLPARGQRGLPGQQRDRVACIGADQPLSPEMGGLSCEWL